MTDPELIDDDNPEWTDEMFARARAAAEVLGAAFMRNARQRQGLARPRQRRRGGGNQRGAALGRAKT